jgi:tetratricopeptide (TPR) repeat protein
MAVTPPESLDLDSAVAAWLADLDRQREAGACPTPIGVDELVRTASGRASVEEAGAVREHVATCLPCLNAYAELVSAATSPAGPEEPVSRDGAFIGRRRELDALLGALDRVIGGVAASFCLTGAPGIGKSRLLEQFRGEAVARGVRVVRARCSPRGSTAPYRPLRDLLRGLCGFGNLDSDDVIRQRLEVTIRAAGLNVNGTVPFAAELARVTDHGVVPDPSVMKQKLVEILRALVLRASQEQALVLEIEDLQWCDAASAACLALLVPGLRAGRVLFLGTFRSGKPMDWVDAAGAVTIAVPPLTPEEGAALLAAIVAPEAAPAALAAEIVTKAQGSPLVLEELALTLRTTRLPSDVLAVFADGTQLLRARMAMLDEDAQHLLRVAAVQGLQGTLGLLRAVAGSRGIRFDRALGDLEAAGFVVSMAEGDDRRFRFRHALIQETVYGGIEAHEREALHGSVARALESRHESDTDTVVDTLAHHFGLSRDDDKAVDYAVLAAGQMTRRAANAEALLVLDTALARLVRMADTPTNRMRRIDVVLAQTEARFGLGQHAELMQAMRNVQALVEQAIDPRRRATWHYWMGFLHTLSGGGPAEAIEHCREASLIADAAGIEDVYAYSESCLNQALATSGELREAMEHGKRALAIFENTRNAWWCCRTLWHLASAALNLGQWRESAAFCQRALEHGRSVSDSRLMAVAWLRLGAAHVHRGEWETGILFCDEAARLTHTDFDAAMLKVNRGYGLVRGRQYDAGIASIEAGVEWFQRAGLRLSQVNAEVRLAEAHLRGGNSANAVVLARGVLTVARQLGYRHLEAVAQATLGEALVDADPGEAARALNAAGEVLEEMGALNDLARVKAAQAQLARAGGDGAGAITLLTSAVRLYEALGTIDEVARVRAALARAQGRPRT